MRPDPAVAINARKRAEAEAHMFTLGRCILNPYHTCPPTTGPCPCDCHTGEELI